MTATTELVLRVRDELIADGVAEVTNVYDENDEKRVGALEGFRICETLETPLDYQVVLESRNRRDFEAACEVALSGDAAADRAYWEYRYATLQVEYVYDRLRVVWGLGPTYSARAVVKVAEVLERIQA